MKTQSGWLTRLVRPEANIVLFFVLACAVGTILSPHFLDVRFLMDSSTLYADLGMIALAFTFLLISGEVDLSVASNMTLVACITATLYKMGVPMTLLIPAALVIGVVPGLVNGILVVTTGLSSLIITIATLSLYRGLAQVLIGDVSISGFPAWFVAVDKRLAFGFLPVPLLMVLAVAVVMEVILQRTVFGRNVSALGTNAKASLYSGVRVNRVKIVLFGLVGLGSGIAGLLSMSRLQRAMYAIGLGGELDVVTMVLLGGAAFSGGSGSVTGTLLAFFVLVILRTAMLLVNLKRFDQMAIVGVLLILVMIISERIAAFRRNRT